jgi:hypothetical protein
VTGDLGSGCDREGEQPGDCRDDATKSRKAAQLNFKLAACLANNGPVPNIQNNPNYPPTLTAVDLARLCPDPKGPLCIDQPAAPNCEHLPCTDTPQDPDCKPSPDPNEIKWECVLKWAGGGICMPGMPGGGLPPI